MSCGDARAALAMAADVGPYFETLPWRAQAGWRSLAELAEPTGAMADRVAEGASTLTRVSGAAAGELETRVVASTVSLGLFVRLVGPPLAAAVLGGLVPHWSLATLWWQPVAGGPWPLAVSETTSGTTVGDVASEEGARDAAAVLCSTVIVGVVEPVVRAVRAEFGVSERVLWGNVASAVGGAARTLVEARPDRADATSRLVAELLDQGPLVGTGQLVQPDPSAPLRFFVRRSCCLFYRVPGAGYCGDCILTPPEARRDQWQSALTRRAR